jgi:hypothetical protein
MEKTNKQKWELIRLVVGKITETGDIEYRDKLFSSCWGIAVEMGILPDDLLDADRIERI